MRNLEVYIECNGNMINVGSITGHNSADAVFSYSEEYIEDKSSRAISISLPLAERSFSPERTRCFFESLLPEGYTRKCVAGWLHVDENDYISVLSELGSECLGAIRIVEGDTNIKESAYRLLSHEELLEFAREGATKSAELVIKSHLSLAGASGKTGLYYDRNNNEWYQPAGLAPSTHILKQSHVRLKKIVANEQLCLLTARKLGLGKGIAMQHFLSMVEKFEEALEQSAYELEQQGYGVAVGIQKQILKKAGIHNFKLTNP